MTTSPYASTEQLAAHGKLLAVVAAKVDAGQRIPCCARPDLWLSDDPADAEAAVHGCSGCSALDACRRYIEQHHEGAGTWAAMPAAERNPRRKPTPRSRGPRR